MTVVVDVSAGNEEVDREIGEVRDRQRHGVAHEHRVGGNRRRRRAAERQRSIGAGHHRRAFLPERDVSGADLHGRCPIDVAQDDARAIAAERDVNNLPQCLVVGIERRARSGTRGAAAPAPAAPAGAAAAAGGTAIGAVPAAICAAGTRATDAVAHVATQWSGARRALRADGSRESKHEGDNAGARGELHRIW